MGYLREGGLDRKVAVRNMFAAISPRYDFLNRLLSLCLDVLWRKRATRELMPIEDGLVLDVCAGTLDLTVAVLKRSIFKGRCVGSDFCLEMLVQGRPKVARQGYEARVDMVCADAESLSFKEGVFDGAVVGFGIRNVPSPEKALAEMGRVVKSGSKVVVLEFSQPKGILFSLLFNLYFHRILPFVGALISGHRDAYRYLPTSTLSFPSPDEFKKIMEAAGLKDVKIIGLTASVATIYVGVKK